jgi:hypothetical protein
VRGVQSPIMSLRNTIIYSISFSLYFFNLTDYYNVMLRSTEII